MSARDPAERALERETEDYERQRREDRVRDHTPTEALYGARTRVARIPVLLGGGAHGLAWSDDLSIVRYRGGMERDDEELYRTQKYAPPRATVALRFCAWEGLSPVESLSMAWDWLLDHALPEPPPIAAEDFERPTTGERLRHVEAIEAVLRRKLPALPYLTDEWIRQLAEECLAAADTGI